MTTPRTFDFRVERDADGFPHVANEPVWATPAAGGLYVVVNIAFFARAATLGHTVAVEADASRLWYRATSGAPANSLLRVLLPHRADTDPVAAVLKRRGGSFERGATGQRLAVNVPPEAPLRAVLAHPAVLEAVGRGSYEGVVLRQPRRGRARLPLTELARLRTRSAKPRRTNNVPRRAPSSKMSARSSNESP